MVTFVIESNNATKVVYKYFPENHTDSSPGIISVQLENGDISINTVAEKDFICRTSADELNLMHDAINEMRKENGEPPLTEEELPTATESDEWYYYADHVICRIRDEMRNGNIPKSGTIAWY